MHRTQDVLGGARFWFRNACFRVDGTEQYCGNVLRRLLPASKCGQLSRSYVLNTAANKFTAGRRGTRDSFHSSQFDCHDLECVFQPMAERTRGFDRVWRNGSDTVLLAALRYRVVLLQCQDIEVY